MKQGLIRRVVRVGDALGVVIPPRWLREEGLQRGHYLALELKAGELVLRPVALGPGPPAQH